MVLAVGTGRALRALPKAIRPRGVGVFHRPRQKATQQAGMAIPPCAAGLCSFDPASATATIQKKKKRDTRAEWKIYSNAGKALDPGAP